MQIFTVSLVFAASLLVWLAARLWLSTRQMRHVTAHRDRVPEPFAGIVDLAVHRKAADYTLAKGRLGLFSMTFSATVLLLWTLLGGLDALNMVVRDATQPAWGDMGYQLALLAAFVGIGALLDLPFEWLATFRVEQRFGFNRMTPSLFWADQAKSLLVAALIGLPLAALVLWLMGHSGGQWWLWAWLTWVVFTLALMVLYPTVIAPLFNKFEPLADEGLKARVQAL
ncbi:MAG: M48 family peptidase, partial [Rubrivivax sp.]|nr:M48 family peptidase [Rubrivivax sp.]